MRDNPFLEIAERLSRIEHCLIGLNQQTKDSNRSSNSVGELLTINEAALYLSLSVPTIYTKVSKREIPFMKRGKRLYFSKPELLAYLNEGRCETKAEIDNNFGQYVIKSKRRS